MAVNPLDDSPFTRRQISIKTVVFQCGTALSLWFIFYTVIVAHCFVVWKWDTPKPNASLDGPIRDFRAAIARSEQRISDREEHLSDMGRLHRRILDKIADLQKSDAALIGMLPAASYVAPEPSLHRLKQLLKIKDIVEYRSASKAIVMAIMELKSYLDNDDNSNPPSHEAFHPMASLPSLHAALVAVPTTMTYNSISLCSESGISAVQIREATPVIKRNQNSPLPIIQSSADMESLIETLQLAISDAKIKASNNKAQRENCLSSLERPVEWLEAGLNAWNIQDKDVRQALLQIMREQDGILNVTLDSSLDLSASSTRHLDAAKRPTKQPLQDILLRDVLDTPFLQALAVYCDTLLDFLGGHNDAIDEFMDRHLYSLLASDDASLGQMAVDRLLNLTGGLTIRHIVERVRSMKYN
jgi:hypothetical protein